MKEFKGTPGPWTTNNQWFGPTNAVSWISIENDNKNIIAEAKGKHCSIPNKECKYNAQLIASAPELLEALQLLVNTIDNLDKSKLPVGTILRLDNTINIANEAINKALGL